MIKRIDVLRIGGDPVEFLIMEKINEIIDYLNQEAAKGGSNRASVGIQKPLTSCKPPRKSLKYGPGGNEWCQICKSELCRSINKHGGR